MSNLTDALVTLCCAAASAGAALATLNMWRNPGGRRGWASPPSASAHPASECRHRRRDRRAVQRELIALKRADLILSDQLMLAGERTAESFRRKPRPARANARASSPPN